jgi:fatty acid desaturase
MALDTIRRPQLPRRFYQRSTLAALAFIAYSLLLYAIPAYAALEVVRSGLDPSTKLLLLIPLVLLAQQGLHLAGWVGHEGTHLTLFGNKYASVFVGTLVSSLIPGFVNFGAALSHWMHHRYTNQPSDPHVAMFPQYRSFWSRLLFARPTATRMYTRDAVRVALGRPLPYRSGLPFSDSMKRTLARTNLALTALFLTLYVAWTLHDPLAALVVIWLPFAAGVVHSGLRIYIEHAGTGTGLFVDTRTYSSPLFTLLYFGNNFHLEHHLYPGVPCYRLPGVHRHLAELGVYARTGALIDRKASSYLRPTTSRMPYPEAVGPDSPHDPYVSAVQPAGSDAGAREAAAPSLG